MLLAPALGLTLAAAMTACSSGSNTTSSTPTSATPAGQGTSATPASSGSAATIAAITANWEAFFSASTPTAKRVELLQNGQKFAGEIQALSGGLASSASAKVASVTVNSPTQATVKYQVLLGGQPAPIPAQTGTAVYEGGTWKVDDASFCTLLGFMNNGKAPSVCSSAA